MTVRIIPVDPFDLVVFGGTGDLTRRKLLPALFQRDRAGQIPPDARIVAAARSDQTTEGYRAFARTALEEFVPAGDLQQDVLERFFYRLSYARVDLQSGKGMSDLSAMLAKRGEYVRAFYLAVGPEFFGTICRLLADSGLATPQSRIIVEKPLGKDLASARELNAAVAQVFDEHRIYRIDHYLGKETVQNLMALRFANALFEPLWNARHIDHVQITVAEDIGVGGRGGYYDTSGAMRDMVQNHLLQLLCLTAMEPPARFEPDAVRDEKLKVLRALEPIGADRLRTHTVRGQYAKRNDMASYLADAGVSESRTETFVALKAEIGNWRWSGTPFYLRTGKRLRARMSEIVIDFKEAPHSIFPKRAGEIQRNVMVIRLQPDEGVTLQLMIKDPGPGGMRLRAAPLDMTFAESLGIAELRMPDAYERLVLDVIRGDQTLFMRRDEVEAAWAWIDPIIEGWAASGERPKPYDPGGSGPEDAWRLMHQDNRSWREIEA